MKKVLALLPTILLIISCNQKQKEQAATPESKPQLTAAEIRNQEIYDSLQQIKRDSLALIAWGDAKFGMSMRETLATENFKNGTKFSGKFIHSITMHSDRTSNLKRALALNDIPIIEASFHENELDEIHIRSHPFTANNIDKLISDCNVFIRNFTEKYGAPSFKKDKVRISDFNSDEEFEYAKFQVGDKRITMLIASEEYQYYYKIDIDNKKFPKKKHTQTEKEEKEIRKRMEEAEKIKNNSF